MGRFFSSANYFVTTCFVYCFLFITFFEIENSSRENVFVIPYPIVNFRGKYLNCSNSQEIYGIYLSSFQERLASLARIPAVPAETALSTEEGEKGSGC